MLKDECTILFDLDGTLIDSFYIYHEAVNHVLSQFGISCTYEEASEHAGLHGEGLYTIFLKKHGKYNALNAPMLKRMFDTKFSALLNGVTLPKESIDTIIELEKRGHKMAICTGAPRILIDTVLPYHIKPLFGSIISCEDVTNMKPDPETFLKAAIEMNIPPSNCIVVGDGKYDLIGASQAGMPFILVRNEYNTEINEGYIHEINNVSEIIQS